MMSNKTEEGQQEKESSTAKKTRENRFERLQREEKSNVHINE